MTRYSIFAIFITALLAAGIGWYLWPSVSAPGPVPGQPQNPNYPMGPGEPVSTPEDPAKAAVRTAFQNEIASYDTQHTKTGRVIIQGGYALLEWSGDYAGGEALLKLDTSKNGWVFVHGGGGEWEVAGLVSAGVPTTTAQALISELGR